MIKVSIIKNHIFVSKLRYKYVVSRLRGFTSNLFLIKLNKLQETSTENETCYAKLPSFNNEYYINN